MTSLWYLAIIPARNISKLSKYHSPLRGSWYFGQFWYITRGIIAKYHCKSCYYLYKYQSSTVGNYSHYTKIIMVIKLTLMNVVQLGTQLTIWDLTYLFLVKSVHVPPAWFGKINFKSFAVDISICLHLSEWHICVFCPRLIVVNTLPVSTPKNWASGGRPARKRRESKRWPPLFSRQFIWVELLTHQLNCLE